MNQSQDTTKRYFGKYRGLVVNNIDPMFIGRLLVQVSDVKALLPSTWAMPCVPIAGTQCGAYVVPAVGAGVWVEFEHGDPQFPIWVGGYWLETAEVPALAQAGLPGSPSIVLQTLGQNTIAISDLPGAGGILLKSATGALIMVNEVGITISNGQGATIIMAGPTVTINEGALVIT